jgi:hypothetical protein
MPLNAGDEIQRMGNDVIDRPTASQSMCKLGLVAQIARLRGRQNARDGEGVLAVLGTDRDRGQVIQPIQTGDG